MTEKLLGLMQNLKFLHVCRTSYVECLNSSDVPKVLRKFQHRLFSRCFVAIFNSTGLPRIWRETLNMCLYNISRVGAVKI